MANVKPDINRLVWPEDGNKFQWLDRAKTIMDMLTRAGIMLLGYNAFERTVEGSGISGAIVSQIAMKLAQSNNLASGAAGVATLSGLGILNVYDANNPPAELKATLDWIRWLHPVTWGEALREALP